MVSKTVMEILDISYQIENVEDVHNQKCLIVGLFSMKEKNIDLHLTNVEILIESNKGICVGNLIQRRGVSRAKKVGGSKKLDNPMSNSTFIEKGKAEELVKLAVETKADTIIFLNPLSAGQKQRLSEMTNCHIVECVIL